MSRKRKDRGVSLLEVVIAAAILGIVAYALYLVLMNSTVTYTNQTRLGDIQERARRVLDEMAKELREADLTNTQITTNSTYNCQSIRFKKVTGYNQASNTFTWSPWIEYKFELSPVDANNNGNPNDDGRIVRSEGTAPNVKTVRLTDYVRVPGGMTITRSGENVTIQVNFRIADYRNKILETSLSTSASLRNETKQAQP